MVQQHGAIPNFINYAMQCLDAKLFQSLLVTKNLLFDTV